jgi:hypothetical protein
VLGWSVVAEVLWRCEVCGKWSHAKRRPRDHRRFIVDLEWGATSTGWGWLIGGVLAGARAEGRTRASALDQAGDLGLPVVEMVGSTWHQTTPDDGDYSPGGVWVLCGPFEAYEARPVVTEAEELEVHRLMMRLRDLARGQELAR